MRAKGVGAGGGSGAGAGFGFGGAAVPVPGFGPGAGGAGDWPLVVQEAIPKAAARSTIVKRRVFMAFTSFPLPILQSGPELAP